MHEYVLSRDRGMNMVVVEKLNFIKKDRLFQIMKAYEYKKTQFNCTRL
jgi:hypothetical protein